MTDLQPYLQQHRSAFERQLCQLLSIPSISTDPQYRQDVRRAAQWLVRQFQTLGLATELVETSGHPVVLAESPPVPGASVALVYGHYDVQPPDPLDEWISPPFEPTERDGKLYARGATDDKGQMFTHVKSVEAWMKAAGRLPIQVKYLIEGEEEVGSPHLPELLAKYRDRLACDVVVISDMSQFAPGQPAITYGLRGIAYYELRLEGPKQDLHSGTFGGAVANPVNALTQILAAMVDGQGRIQIPQFYEDVVPLRDEERQRWQSLNFDEEAFRHQVGVEALSGEAGYTSLERRWARPTFDIHGIWGGYQGEGGKTVLPARAGAKFSFRLVPNQDPEQITASLRHMLKSLCPPGIRMQLFETQGSPGYVAPLESPFIAAAQRAIEQGFGKRPVFIREGGSIPIVSQLSEHLNAEVLLLGWGLDDDNTHSPNEKFSLEDFHRAIGASAQLWYELSQIKRSA